MQTSQAGGIQGFPPLITIYFPFYIPPPPSPRNSPMLQVTLLTISQTTSPFHSRGFPLSGWPFLSFFFAWDTPQMPCSLSSFLESPDRINGTIYFLTIINGASMLISRDTKMKKTRDCHSLVRMEKLSDKLPYIVHTSNKKFYHWAEEHKNRWLVRRKE